MSFETRNPAALAQGRAGMSIIGLDDRDATSHSANASYPQAFIARKFHLQPVVARLVCDLAGIGGRAR